ncbi:unnamed protein product [Rotaria sp. Silwood1]|nr:unnamed protein product [Rotaria sp. Silwood1]CAF5037579.1 unnamed protein product [Rotaria sp. Silwood1]
MSSTSGQFLTIHHNGETDQTTTLLDLPSITSSSPTAEIEFNTTDKLEYLSQLLKDKRQLSAAPNMFIHIDRLLDQEINKAEGEDYLKKKQLTELAIINGTYREPNLFSKKFPFQNNQIPIGAPLILTPRIQQNFLTTSMPPNTTPTFFTTTETQPTTISTVPQSSLLQNGESNFLQVFTPLQTIDSIGGMLTSGTHLFEYPSQTAFPFLTTTTATGIKYIFTITFVKQHHALAVIVVLDIIKAKVLIYSLTVC